MRKRLRSVLIGILGALAILVLVAANILVPTLTSYHAKIMCSCVFLSNRAPSDIIASDLSAYSFVQHAVDVKKRKTTSSLWGVFSRTAIYRNGLGCTLLSGASETDLQQQASGFIPDSIQLQPHILWPQGDSLRSKWPEEVDKAKLENAVEWAFKPGDFGPTGTRAVLVSYDSLLLAEKYAWGFTQDTRLTGWSMTKSITHALVGILVQEGQMAIAQKGLFPEWLQDRRANISLDHMLRMSSGLKFNEFYFGPTDATRMLFLKPGAGAYAKSLPAKHDPDSVWYYSSGTSNMISLLIKEKVGEDYWNFPRKRLFNSIGMSSAVMEPDASGTFVGSSFMYATARDWARFGLLYLWEGDWMGRQILPEGWAKYARTPTPPAPQGMYGAQFWLNAGDKDSTENRPWPSIPNDLYYASGFEGQFVFIIPSYNLVIVRLGFTPNPQAFDVETFLAQVLAAFPSP